MRVTFPLLAVALILTIAAVSPASAQCKWCVTPTKCDDVDEDAAASCTEHAGGGCENNGICIIIETDDQELATPTQMMWSAIVDAGIEVIELDTPLFGSLPFLQLAVGVMGAFNCQGELAMVAATNGDGSVTIRAPDASQRAMRLSDLWIRTVGFAADLDPR